MPTRDLILRDDAYDTDAHSGAFAAQSDTDCANQLGFTSGHRPKMRTVHGVLRVRSSPSGFWLAGTPLAAHDNSRGIQQGRPRTRRVVSAAAPDKSSPAPPLCAVRYAFANTIARSSAPARIHTRSFSAVRAKYIHVVFAPSHGPARRNHTPPPAIRTCRPLLRTTHSFERRRPSAAASKRVRAPRNLDIFAIFIVYAPTYTQNRASRPALPSYPRAVWTQHAHARLRPCAAAFQRARAHRPSCPFPHPRPDAEPRAPVERLHTPTPHRTSRYRTGARIRAPCRA